MPTVAFNFRKVRKGNIVLKIWDVAGASMLRQPLVLSLTKDSVGVQANQSFAQCGNVIAMELMPLCMMMHFSLALSLISDLQSFVVDSTDVRRH